MRYGLLLLPHANARYQASQRQLALAALRVMERAFGEISRAGYESIGPLELLCFDAPEGSRALKAIERFSMGYALFSLSGGTLNPVSGPYTPPLSDMAGILKYKGKTNESFSALLLELSILSGAFFDQFDQPLKVLDPMCGRGTGLFVALARGYQASGIEKDARDIHELDVFVKNYMKYNRFKHEETRQSMTVQGRAAARRTQIAFSTDAQGFKAGARQTLRYTHGDARDAASFYKGEKFHALFCDLPYSVQHKADQGGRAKPEQLVRACLPGWDAVLRPGAAIALSFNRYVTDKKQLAADFADAGYLVLDQPPYDGFEHWVEQAVLRDIFIAAKPE